ncbi:MAG TPA: hypothetical protein PLR86_08675, partial [Planctomycetota bacterium]|nr:hypothetical protein [Planctomycetota bacterium]
NYLLSEFSTKYKDDYIILYHAFGKQEDWCDPLLIIKNMFLSIRKNIYDDSIENVSSFSSSFPNNLDSLQIYCQQILDNCSKEILQPNQKKMVIFLDGIDYLALSSERLKTFISVFPKNLPANIFVLLSWQMQEDKSILSEGYILDGIPLYPFKEYPIECRELQGSPLTCFSQQEMLKWLMHDFPMIPTYRKNELCKILWNKSKGGDLRYFSLWREAIYQGRLQWDCWDLWPEGHLEFYNSIIENLPAHENYVAYNFLLLLCIVQHECTDEFVGQVFQIPYYIIAPIRWQLNLVLEYTKGGYSLISWMSQYLEKIIPIKEQQEMHQILAKFYQQQDRSGGDMRQKALYYLPKHLCEGKKFQEAYTLLVESSFPTEKLRYFKSYQPYLYDIYQILYSYYKSKQYEDFLPMMYRYHLILQEATCDIQKAFQASANGKYEFALDTIRLNQDENEQFQEMLVVLWYALQEENTKHAIYILEEFKRIPDSHIVLFSKGIRPFFEFLLKRLKQKNILRVDYLIGKNTFQGQKAINYLLELQSKINFPSSQLYFLMHVIFKHMDSIESDKEKQNIVQKVSPIWFQLESDKSFVFLRVLETKKTLLYFWGKLLSFVDSIQNIEIRWECLYSLYHTAWETKQEQYWNPIQERAKNFQNSSPSGQTLAYILCILEFDGESFFKEQYNNIFLKELFDTLFAIWKEKPTDKVAYDWLIRLLLHSEIVEIIDKEKFIHLLATQGDIEKALSLLNQITNIRMRAKLFLIILDYIQENISDEHIWNLALDTFSDITSERDFIENITAKIATGLWESGFVTHDTLWKKFQTICENVAEISIRNKILTVLTLEYAGHDLVNKARNLLLKVTSSHLYSNALVGIAQQLF